MDGWMDFLLTTGLAAPPTVLSMDFERLEGH
jgi:hypothetical protein